MESPDLTAIKWVLTKATLKDCLEWFEQSRDQHLSAVLGPLLFDIDSSEIRHVSDQELRVELFALATNDFAFRTFLLGKYHASLDQITARYLAEHLGLP